MNNIEFKMSGEVLSVMFNACIHDLGQLLDDKQTNQYQVLTTNIPTYNMFLLPNHLVTLYPVCVHDGFPFMHLSVPKSSPRPCLDVGNFFVITSRHHLFQRLFKGKQKTCVIVTSELLHN